VAKVVEMAEQTGAAVVVAHISACQAAQKVKEARERGARVFGETCPHYLWLEQSRLREPGLQGAAYICAPPLRDVTHMDCLWKAIRGGWIDILGTDHCPFNLKGEKDRGYLPNGCFDFTKVPGGLPGIQLRLLLAYVGGVLTERFDLVRLAKIFAEIPARVFGLAPKKGALVAGADADIVILDPAGITSFDAEDLSMRVDYSPYEGMRMEGRVETVLSRGEIIVSEGAFVGSRGRGRFVACGPYTEDKGSPEPGG
jgi:dihydropyrimidinase